MKTAAITIILILFAFRTFSQEPLKVVRSKFANGQKEVLETYLGEEKPENLVKRETFAPNGNKVKEESYRNQELSGLKKEWTETGEKIFEGNFAGGKPDGIWKRWDPSSGKPVSEQNFAMGNPAGKQVYFFTGGETKAEFNYASGKIEGLQKDWHSPLQIRFELNYSGGIPHGEQVEYFSDGTPMFRMNFVAGKPEGVQKFYEKPGAEPTVETWTQGKYESLTSNWPSGLRKEITFYEYEILNPDTMPLRGRKMPVRKTTFFETGSVMKIEDLVGSPKTKIFYVNGGTEVEGGGTDSKREGLWTWYSKEGKVIRKGNYIAGKEEGEWMEFDEQGRERVRWTTLEGGARSDQTVSFYHSNSQLESKGNIDEEGRKNGKWEYWFDDGKLRRQETYSYHCKQIGGRPYLDDFTEWLKDKRVASAGSERDLVIYEYDDENKLTTEHQLFRPFRSPCTKGVIEYYKEGKMIRNEKILDDESGNFVKADSAVRIGKVVMDFSGQARSVDRYNKSGFREGMQEAWYASGVRKFQFEFLEGKILREAKEWYPNGQIRIDVFFAAGHSGIPEKGKYFTDDGSENEFELEKHKELKKKMLEIMEGSNLSTFLAAGGR